MLNYSGWFTTPWGVITRGPTPFVAVASGAATSSIFRVPAGADASADLHVISGGSVEKYTRRELGARGRRTSSRVSQLKLDTF